MNKLSVIIPYKDCSVFRQEAFQKLLQCIESQTMTEFEVIVVEQINNNSYCTMGSLFLSLFLKKTSYIHKLVQDPVDRPFNKSWLVNIGIRNANSDNILVLDADSLFGKEYFEYILTFAKTHKPFFHGYNWIVLMPGRDNPITRVSAHKNIESVGGTWFTCKHFYWEILGGMNENYFGYGREDSDLWIRANYFLKVIPEINYPLTHQYHHWAVVDTKNAPEYRKNCEMWRYTKNNTSKIIERLKRVNLGNIKEPTLIDMEIA